jgi:3-phenylpropionate/cinnamic acid dioxygenase small subunit
MESVQTSPAEASTGQRIRVGSEIYNQILEFLYDEADLLDQIRLKEWGALLAQDLVYTVPQRATRLLAEQAQSVVRSVMHYDDNYRSVMGRIMRATGKSAWAEDPPSRTRRLVTNVRVETTGKADEFAVRSYLLLTRSRFNHDEYDLVSCERRDVIRREGASYLLARREVIIDQAVLGTPNLAVFL